MKDRPRQEPAAPGPATSLEALSPLDGRYVDKVAPLGPLFSELALMRYRLQVEVAWVKALAAEPGLPELPALSAGAVAALDAIVQGFSLDDGERIKALEQRCNHDVKAVEYFLRERCEANPALVPCVPFIHFACTSEDINNLAYALMLKQARDQQFLPLLRAVMQSLATLARRYRTLPMMCRTHGQPASPSTLGRELGVFIHRLQRQSRRLADQLIMGKINGATGNYNAHILACPDTDWPSLARGFVESLGLHWNAHTTQIESHDYIVELLDAMTLVQHILTDLCRDIWGYIALGFFRLPSEGRERVGSSTMPHKINPIDFENAEGNFGMANAVARHLAHSLPLSRWQRDLSDSTSLRNLGVVFGHGMVGLQALDQGLGKLQANEEYIQEELAGCWQLLAEPVQTVMRRYGVPDAYERLRDLTRTGEARHASLLELINGLDVPEPVREMLLNLTPACYTGNAVQQVDAILQAAETAE